MFPPDVIAAAASWSMFDRADWAVMLSCFACLWHEVVDKFVKTDRMDIEMLIGYLKTPAAAKAVAAYTSEWGYPPHPHTLVQNYIEGDSTSPKKRKRSINIRRSPP